MVAQYIYVECTLAACFLDDALKYECDHYDAINRIEIRLKKERQAISKSKFIVEYTIEIASVCGVESMIDETMIPEIAYYAAAVVGEQFVQTLVILQKTIFLTQSS